MRHDKLQVEVWVNESLYYRRALTQNKLQKQSVFLVDHSADCEASHPQKCQHPGASQSSLDNQNSGSARLIPSRCSHSFLKAMGEIICHFWHNYGIDIDLLEWRPNGSNTKVSDRLTRTLMAEPSDSGNPSSLIDSWKSKRLS